MEDTICGWPRVHVPAECKGVDVIVGIDEAGRGPVLGSLIYCAAFWPVSLHDEICKMSFDDSKKLDEKTRDGMFTKIKSHPAIGWVIQELTAEYLSEEMMRVSPISLNTLSYGAVVTALETIRDHNHPTAPIVTDVFVDTVGDPDFYKSTLIRSLGTNFAKFTIEKKADANYKVVGAASIIAKVTRDTLMKQWTWEGNSKALQFTTAYGSGYPSDPACVSWMSTSCNETVFAYPNLVRFSWSTAKECIKNGACDVNWECDEEEDVGGANIKNYFSASSEKRIKRSGYFMKRKMTYVTSSDVLL